MALTIAGTEFKTLKPKDLDAKLVASTGCNAAENLARISAATVPGRIALALAPFLTGTVPPIPRLAAMIRKELETEGTTLIADIKALFTGSEAPAVDETGEENGSSIT